MKQLFVCAALLCASCQTGVIDELLGSSAHAPEYTGYKVRSATQIDFHFSTDVKAVSARFDPNVKLRSETSGATLSITTESDCSGGRRFVADILVEDVRGNTLSVLVPFRTRNDRVPRFVINEARVEYSKPRAEFIEIKTLEAGNLGALRLFITSANPTEAVYEFPSVEVKKDEYVLLHLRTLSTDNGIDELDNNLNLAKSGNEKDTPPNARDLWLHTDKKLVHKTDVIYFVDQDDNIIDGVVFAENSSAWKKNAALGKAAEKLAKQNKWLNKDGVTVRTPQFEDAVVSAGTTATKTLNRDADTRTCADWYLCATSKCSPGLPNAPRNE